MIAVMEQTDVPARGHVGQKVEQGPRAFREFKPEQTFVRNLGPAAHHVANMQFRHFIVGEIHHRVTALLQFLNDGGPLRLPLAELDARKDMGLGVIGIAVVELGNGPPADGAAEFLEAAGPLRDGHRQQHFALFPQFGPFGHMAETVKIHVGPGIDRRQGRAG